MGVGARGWETQKAPILLPGWCVGEKPGPPHAMVNAKVPDTATPFLHIHWLDPIFHHADCSVEESHQVTGSNGLYGGRWQESRWEGRRQRMEKKGEKDGRGRENTDIRYTERALGREAVLKYLVVSPSLLVNCAPSALTAIRNWYKLIDASMATLRPTGTPCEGCCTYNACGTSVLSPK